MRAGKSFDASSMLRSSPQKPFNKNQEIVTQEWIKCRFVKYLAKCARVNTYMDAKIPHENSLVLSFSRDRYMRYYIHAQQLPYFTGISETRVRQLRDSQLIPEPVDGYYELQPTVKAIIDYYRKKAQGLRSLPLGIDHKATQRCNSNLS